MILLQGRSKFEHSWVAANALIFKKTEEKFDLSCNFTYFFQKLRGKCPLPSSYGCYSPVLTYFIHKVSK